MRASRPPSRGPSTARKHLCGRSCAPRLSARSTAQTTLWHRVRFPSASRAATRGACACLCQRGVHLTAQRRARVVAAREASAAVTHAARCPSRAQLAARLRSRTATDPTPSPLCSPPRRHVEVQELVQADVTTVQERLARCQQDALDGLRDAAAKRPAAGALDAGERAALHAQLLAAMTPCIDAQLATLPRLAERAAAFVAGRPPPPMETPAAPRRGLW